MRFLSRRQLVIVAKVAAGESNDQVAAGLHLSPHTVAAYLSSAMARAGVANRAALVARCYYVGALDPNRWPPTVASSSPTVASSSPAKRHL